MNVLMRLRPAVAVGGLLAGLLLYAPAAHAVDVTNLSGAEAEQMLKAGQITSVQLTQAYIDRIDAVNKSGPALNAVTQLNSQALQEAADSDAARAAGKDLGPAMGLPILLKDIVDAKGQYTSAGNYGLRASFPKEDSGVAAYLRQHGVVLLGKVGLSEFANHFGGQPSGFSNLTGQVLNANDADATPSGSSSGTGAAVQDSLSSLGIGTETSGSIISPSQAEGIVGLRPTVGLVPGYGIAPILASQDTAGPMERTVTDVAMTLQSITGTDPTIEGEAAQEYKDVFGDDYVAKGIIPARPTSIPDYMSALSTDFVKGKRIGYTFTAPNCGAAVTAPNDIAFCALQNAGATMVSVSNTAAYTLSGLSGLEAHKTIDDYYAHLGSGVPFSSMADETTANNAAPVLAEKFGNAAHWTDFTTDDSAGPLAAFRTQLASAKQAEHASFDGVFDRGTSDPSDDLIAVLGTLQSAPQAGYPQITIPLGYTTTQRRPQNASLFGPAYGERDLIGAGYVVEQATKLRQTPEQLDPSLYRCAKEPVAPPFASRGSCNPDYATASAAAGSKDTPDLGVKLETASIAQLQQKLASGAFTSVALTEAYLNRIALTNAQGPGLQAVRALNASALQQAQAADDARKAGKTGAMLGIPVLLDDSFDVAGMTTTAGSIALQANTPSADSAVAAKLKAAGAVILGKTNVTELNNVFDTNITPGYSSLGGQVLDSYDTDKTPAGSSAGSASALSAGLAAATIGLQSSQNGPVTGYTTTTATPPVTTGLTTDPAQTTASAVLPASVMGVDALKPTVGRVSRVGVLGDAKAQDSPTPMGRTIADLAQEMNAVAGIDASDSEQVASGATPPDYASGLSTSLSGHTIGVLPRPSNADFTNFSVTSTPSYDDAISALTGAGGTTSTKTIPTSPASQPGGASVLAREFRRDLNAYLGSGHSGGAANLSGVVDYLAGHATEGLKYSTTGPIGTGSNTCTSSSAQLPGALCAALNSADIGSGGSAGDQATYQSDLSASRSSFGAFLDAQLSGTDALLVPASNLLVGYADRAGYPVLEMQSGYQFVAASTGGYAPTHDPAGVALIGRPDSEATLLDDAYAIEQKLNGQTAQNIALSTNETIPPSTTAGRYVYSDAHASPSEFNPAMFRCIAGSVYADPYDCHPGEIGYVSPVKAPVTPSPIPAPTAPTPTPAPAPAPSGGLAAFVDALQAKALGKALTARLRRGATSLSVSQSFLEAGTARYTLYLVVGKRSDALTRVSFTVPKAETKKVTIKLSKSLRRRLARHPKSKVRLGTRFVSKATGKALTSTRSVRRT